MSITEEFKVSRQDLQLPEVSISQRYIGKAIRRVDAESLLTGRGKFTDDIELPRKIYHLAFLRSPYAHAKIRSVNSSEAKDLTGEDLKDISLPLLF